MTRIERTTDSKALRIAYRSEDSIQTVVGLVTKDGKTHTIPYECCYRILDLRENGNVEIRIDGRKSEIDGARKRGESKKNFTN